VQAIIFSDGGTEEELQALSAMPFLATLESHCHDALRQSPLIPPLNHWLPNQVASSGFIAA
jgi:hypothetical protein